ncbi:hypothetical protein [Vibrio sinaloensis]|nr:hypothetical protein [Vibrio sinaloensis]MCZ4294998.1 hypothetical protein [Vibrio sinaloensis]
MYFNSSDATNADSENSDFRDWLKDEPREIQALDEWLGVEYR